MILGTANFGNEYRGSKLSPELCEEILTAFVEMGGTIIDTAMDYGTSPWIIQKFTKKHKGLTILMKIKEFDITPVGAKILSRGKYVDGFDGQSIYYPHEIDQRSKILEIPASDLFVPYLDVMKLHSQIYVRSLFMLHADINKWRRYKYFGDITDIIIGVQSVEELKKDMELFA